jgi:hypothetical protein
VLADLPRVENAAILSGLLWVGQQLPQLRQFFLHGDDDSYSHTFLFFPAKIRLSE